ncbi:carboxypeptidase-like regulatory domain-containing protein [candidate division WOR-3 bacterium]|nr:carboxypeptidase-like regulatory domain-containing protein [candidate division WOR-3 bacterium]
MRQKPERVRVPHIIRLRRNVRDNTPLQGQNLCFLPRLRVKAGVFFVILSISTLPVRARCEFKSQSELIDSPTAHVSDDWFALGMTFSITTKDDPHWAVGNAYLKVQIPGKLFLGLSIFNLREALVAFDAGWKVNKETQNMPAIMLGCLYLSPYRWISPVGHDSTVGWADDQTYDTKRNSEQFSAFVVATKDFGPYGLYNVGIGRGSLVGYGPRSHLFNTDMFMRDHHNDAVGIIWGGEVNIRKNIFGVLDFDGRDFNVGIKIKGKWYQIGIAAAKLEHRLGGSPILYPRFAAGFIINSHILKKLPPKIPKIGAVAGVVRDKNTLQPLVAKLVFTETTLLPVATDSNGKYTVSIMPGTYRVRAVVSGYYWLEKKIYVAPQMTTICNFELTPKPK